MSLFANIIFFLLLLCASAYFSGTETVLFSLSRVQRRSYRTKKTLAAKKICEIFAKPREILVTILIGNEIANVALSVVGASILAFLIRGDVRMESAISILIITPLLLIFGEIMPKSIAINFARNLVPIVIFPLILFSKIVWPLRVVFTWVANRITHLFGGSSRKSSAAMMEDEFRRLVDLGKKEGALEEEERDLIHKVFDFSDKVVSNIMTPVNEIFSLPVNMPYNLMLKRIMEERFSRVPIYEGELNNIIGILHVRDLFAYEKQKDSGGLHDMKAWLHKSLFVEPNEPIEKLLRSFQMTHLHLALVKGENDILGIVTLDDVLEELFGKIQERKRI
ncbi:MAG: hemolysin family protein [Pseudomonadota bacterium]